MKDFDNPYFTKQCSNCQYKIGFFRSSWKCSLSGYYCTTERKYPSCCAENFEKWKSNDKAFKEIIKLKKKYPQYFI